MVGMKTIQKRCAIYTRKSSEEGLDQDFNSLHAQREACEAYITSQKIEGWNAIKTAYDDGGFSGGTMDRPALQNLIADIRAGKIDIIVVYKIDRLTRSLMDFAKLVEIFDEHNVTFVSVTQSFNTTTSMGRLTLNVLLSFAQFEREVTGERIRDKIAASKKKGMWMGGLPPLGYSLENRKLVPDEAEVQIVHMIFNDYLACGTVVNLYKKLKTMNKTTPVKTSIKGNRYGGKSYSRGYLYKLLRNPVYIGKIVHKRKIYDGLHDPIIDQELFDAVQKSLDENKVASHNTPIQKSRHLLKGRVFDSGGIPYTPTFTNKGQKQYAYYVSQNLLQHNDHPTELPPRIPASDFDDFVIRETVAGIERDFEKHYPNLAPDICNDIGRFLEAADNVTIRNLIEKIVIHRENVGITLSPEKISKVIAERLHISLPAVQSGNITLVAPYCIYNSKNGKRIIHSKSANGNNANLTPDHLERIVKGIVWRDEHFAGKTIKDIAADNKHGLTYVYKCIDESF